MAKIEGCLLIEILFSKVSPQGKKTKPAISHLNRYSTKTIRWVPRDELSLLRRQIKGVLERRLGELRFQKRLGLQRSKDWEGPGEIV